MTEAQRIAARICAILEGEVSNPYIFQAMKRISEIAATLEDGERSAAIHNTLSGFIRCWSDEFAPREEEVGPLIARLFELHAWPEDRSEPK